MAAQVQEPLADPSQAQVLWLFRLDYKDCNKEGRVWTHQPEIPPRGWWSWWVAFRCLKIHMYLHPPMAMGHNPPGSPHALAQEGFQQDGGQSIQWSREIGKDRNPLLNSSWVPQREGGNKSRWLVTFGMCWGPALERASEDVQTAFLAPQRGEINCGGQKLGGEAQALPSLSRKAALDKRRELGREQQRLEECSTVCECVRGMHMVPGAVPSIRLGINHAQRRKLTSVM